MTEYQAISGVNLPRDVITATGWTLPWEDTHPAARDMILRNIRRIARFKGQFLRSETPRVIADGRLAFDTFVAPEGLSNWGPLEAGGWVRETWLESEGVSLCDIVTAEGRHYRIVLEMSWEG